MLCAYSSSKLSFIFKNLWVFFFFLIFGSELNNAYFSTKRGPLFTFLSSYLTALVQYYCLL